METKAQKIRGINVEKLTEKEKVNLLKISCKLLIQQESLYLKEQELKRQKAQLEQDLKDYRIASAKRVLDFIAGGVDKLESKTIHTLLVHCMNKLNGNIDSVELTLKYDNLASKEGLWYIIIIIIMILQNFYVSYTNNQLTANLSQKIVQE